MMVVRILILTMLLSLRPVSARAQAEPPRGFAWEVGRGVLIDPTTYAPALISYTAVRQDWKTSQVLFINGWVEQNARFTISGRPNDVPVGYAEGNARIRSSAFGVLQYSAANNVGARIVERMLVTRYPHNKRLIRTLSWVERIAFASILTYRNSASHFRQASDNRRLAREYGYSRR